MSVILCFCVTWTGSWIKTGKICWRHYSPSQNGRHNCWWRGTSDLCSLTFFFWKEGKSLHSNADFWFSLFMWSLLYLFMFISTNILAVQLFFFQVNEEYFRTLEILSKKLKFVEADQLIKGSKALKDVQPELEKLRQKAVTKVDNSTRCLMEFIS